MSQFDYTYDVVGNIDTWQKQYASNPATLLELGYDAVDQLTAATKMSTDPTPVTLKRYAYAYDPAGNRTAEQVDDAVMAGTHNSRNQLETLQPGGALRFQGALDEEADSHRRRQARRGSPRQHLRRPGRRGRGHDPGRRGGRGLRRQRPDEHLRGQPDRHHHDLHLRRQRQPHERRHEDLRVGRRESTGAGHRRPDRAGELRLRRPGPAVQKTAGGVTTTYIYDGEDIVEERLSTGDQYRYVHGPGIDQPLARVDGLPAPWPPTTWPTTSAASSRKRTPPGSSP